MVAETTSEQRRDEDGEDGMVRGFPRLRVESNESGGVPSTRGVESRAEVALVGEAQR